MTNKRLVLTITMSLFTACAASTPPPAGPPGAPMAVDNGQPKMRATLDALGRAQHELQVAATNKGGHRASALQLVQQAIAEVQAGIEYANAHPREVGAAAPEAAPEPVNDAVGGAGNQPHMAQAMVELREARRQLHEAKGDKGGHRARGLELIKQAEAQIRDGIKFANGH